MTQSLKRFRIIGRILLCVCLLLMGGQSLKVARAQAQTVVYNAPDIAKQDSLIPSALLGVHYQITSLPPFNPEAFNRAKAQMPADLCAHLLNEYDCSRTQEQYWLTHTNMGILRQDKQLTIPLRPSFALVLTDQQGKGGGGWASYIYLGYIPEIQYHHVYVGYYEGGSELLIQAQTGEITVLSYPPVFSPDHQRFVTAGAYGDNPITLQIWQVGGSRLNLETNLLIDNTPVIQNSMQIKQQRWLEPTKVQLDLVTIFTQAPHTWVFAKVGNQWQGEQDGMRLKSLPLYPLQTLNENQRTVYDVDTLGVGKRVYQDRDYQFTQVPDYLVGEQYLRVGNNAMRNTNTDYLHFSLAQPSVVYIAIDDQALHLPAWMADWQPTPDFLLTNDVVHLRLYKKTVPAGIVTLGGNWATGAAGIRSQYIVVVTNNQ